MKSFFTKLGGFLLCAVMLTTVGCHDYAEDIRDLDNKVNADLETVKGDLEAELDEAVAELNGKLTSLYATQEMLNGVQATLNSEIAKNATAITANAGDIKTNADAIDAIQKNGAALQAAINDEIAKLKKADQDNAAAAATATAAVATNLANLSLVVEGVNQAVEALKSSKLDKTTFEEAVATLNERIAKLETSVGELQEGLKKANEDILANAANITKIFGQITELTDKVSGNTTDIDEINGKIDKIKIDIQELQDNKADKTVVAAVEVRVGALEDALEEANKLIANKADKAVVDAALAALDSRVTALEDGLDKANAAIKENAVAIEKAFSTLATKEALAGAVEVLNATIETAKSDLQTALDVLATTTSENLDAAKTELENAYMAADKAINDRVNAIADRVQAIEDSYASETDLENAKKEIVKEYEEADADLKSELKTIIENVEDDLYDQIKRLETLIDALRVDVNNLIKRIQSIVNVPTHVDGNVRIDYAKVGDKVLEGYSTLQYEVYPAEYAADIATVVNAETGEESTPFLSFNVRTVTKALIENALKVVKAEAEGGLLTITVKPNLGKDFYKAGVDQVYCAAALVLEKPATDSNKVSDFYSTVYTNLVPSVAFDDADPVTMGLYINNVETYAKSYSWDYVASTEAFGEILLNGLTPMFTYNGSLYSQGDLKDDFGYDLAITRTVDVPTNTAFKIGDYVAAQLDSYVPVYPTETPSYDNYGEILEVKYTYACEGLSPVSAVSTVEIVDFPYTYFVDCTYPTDPYKISYMDNEKSIVVLEDAFDCYFKKDGQRVEVADVQAIYPKLVSKNAYTVTANPDDLFAVEPKEVEPITYAKVSLAKDSNGANKAQNTDVDKKLTLDYVFDFEVANGLAETRSSEVVITLEQYEFNLGSYSATWTYKADKDQDEIALGGGTANYSRDLGLTVNPEKNDIKYSEVAALYTPVYTVEEATDGDVTGDVTVVFASDKVTVSGFAWDKVYTVKAKYQVVNSGVVGAEVNVEFTFSTTDRERGVDYVITLPEYSTPFKSDQSFTLVPEDLSALPSDAWASFLPVDNQGVGFVLADYLEDAISAGTTCTVNGNAAPANTALTIAADGCKVTTSYDYADFGVYTEEIKYVLTYTAPYGQKFVVNKTVKLPKPKFVFGNSEFLYLAGGYSQVTPIYTGSPITNFEVDKCEMLKVFNSIYNEAEPETNLISELGTTLAVKFYVEESEYAHLMDANNVLMYNCPKEKLNVGAKLYILNSVGDPVEVETNFDKDESEGGYAHYYVSQYNPVGKLTVSTEPALTSCLVIAGEEYKFDLLKLLTLTDKLDRPIISNSTYGSDYDFSVNPNFYNLELDYDIDAAKESVPAEFESLFTFTEDATLTDLTACEVVFNYTPTLELGKGFDVKIPVTYSHTWGKEKAEIVIRFNAPSGK